MLAERAESLVALAHRLTDRDRPIISDMGRLWVLTLEQLARVHFSSLGAAPVMLRGRCQSHRFGAHARPRLFEGR